MKANDIKKLLNVSDEAIQKSMDFNPLQIVLNEEFGKVTEKQAPDYRSRAIDRCLKAKVPFTSESNTIYNMVEKFIKIINPLTGNVMVSNGGGGNSCSTTVEFIDKESGDEVTITLFDDSIYFKPKQKDL